MPRSLPLFPLALVLFPGAPLPLHIFEPRYRAMLADCRAGDGRFGIVLASEKAGRSLERGRVGCVAALRDVQMLEDGRANILVEGAERFTIDREIDASTPYHVALVDAYDDFPADAAALAPAAESVRASFARVARAAREIADDRDAELPELPADPALLAFRVASLVDFPHAQQQALLESRSPLERLVAIDALLRAGAPDVEARAATHRRAKSNGHGHHSA